MNNLIIPEIVNEIEEKCSAISISDAAVIAKILARLLEEIREDQRKQCADMIPHSMSLRKAVKNAGKANDAEVEK